jgi:hypothetical protein
MTYRFYRFYFSTRLNETEDGIHNAICGYSRPLGQTEHLRTALMDGYTLSRASGMYKGRVENAYVLTVAVRNDLADEIAEEVYSFVALLKRRFDQQSVLVSNSPYEIGTIQ